jgi:DNA-binding SARP family transcriptional activator/tetratricopeptide (TPR) repeat protein
MADGESRPVSGVRRKAVLATLALHDGTAVSVGQLADVVWGETTPPTAVNTLQSHVSYLRGVLGSKTAIRARPPGYLLDLGAESTDVQLAERLLRQGTESADRADGVSQLKAALALWRGRSLADLADLARLDDHARRLDLLCLQVKRALSDARLTAGEHIEHVHAQLMLALYRGGRQADALAVYQRLRRTLGDELGIDPIQSLRELETAILRQDPTLDLATEPVTLKPTAPRVPAQLPSAVHAFAGREAELDGLDAIVHEAAQAGHAYPAAVISGTAGVGKTALAVHWAHRVAERFPDGQLYVNLRGFDPARAPLDPGEVLRGFLDALGVPARSVPRGADAQLGLYRTTLSGKRVLVLLDNARDADQVRALLPGAPGCMAIVTSRTRLTPLVATEGAKPLTLGLLTAAQSSDLLAARLGTGRIAAEPRAAGEIVARCAGLPLALAIVAARGETDPDIPLSVLAGQLRDSTTTLDMLTAGDESTDLRAVFSWSTAALSPVAAELYVLLGLHPGPDLAAAAAVSLSGWPPERIRRHLGELVRAHLLTEHVPGRFTFHDLLRAYAAEQARTRCTGLDQRAATHRMLDYYLHSAQEAARLLYGPWDHLPLDCAQPGADAERFGAQAQAMAWLSAEYQVLLGCVELAAGAGFGRHAWRLSRTMASYFEQSGHWRDWVRVQRLALAAALSANDTEGLAHARHQLGNALIHVGEYDPAAVELDRALALFGELGDDAHRAQVHLCTGYLSDCRGADQEALRQSQRALTLFRAAGHETGEAIALNNIGWSLARHGDYDEALQICLQALHLHEQATDRQGQAGALDTLGYIHQCRADHTTAIACYLKGVDFYWQIRDGYNEAGTLTRLGDVYRAAGDHHSARRAWRRALRLYEALDHPDAARLRHRLHSHQTTSAPLLIQA